MQARRYISSLLTLIVELYDISVPDIVLDITACILSSSAILAASCSAAILSSSAILAASSSASFASASSIVYPVRISFSSRKALSALTLRWTGKKSPFGLARKERPLFL
jgi:hypothetical protein